MWLFTSSLKYKQTWKNKTILKTIFVTGTAGAGKSLLTSKIYDYYTQNSAFAAVLNLDPGVENVPYTCDIDVRDYVDIVSVMKKYDLGPNGALFYCTKSLYENK